MNKKRRNAIQDMLDDHSDAVRDLCQAAGLPPETCEELAPSLAEPKCEGEYGQRDSEKEKGNGATNFLSKWLPFGKK